MRILDFSGEIPKKKPQSLGQTQAQLAENVDLYGGYLRPHRNPHFMQQVVDEYGRPFSDPDDAKMFIPMGNHFVGMREEVHWVYDPRNSAGIGTVLFVRDGSLWRLSCRMVDAGTGPTPVGIEPPTEPPVVAKVAGVGCLSLWDARACAERDLKCSDCADAPELRAYRITYVNECGEESAASYPSEMLDIRNGDGVAVTDTNTPPANAVKRRIYRSAVTTAGTTVWLLAGEDIIADRTFIDDVCPEHLGEMLPYERHHIPKCLNGIALTRNLQTVVWSGNEFWVSAPKSPHIYEPKTRVTLPYRIRFIAHYTSSVEGDTHYNNVLATDGYPYTISVRDDGQTSVKEVQVWYPAVSEFGYTAGFGAVHYVSDVGIITFDSKTPNLLTDELMTEREWAQYRPETVRLTAYDQRLFAWYSTDDGTRAGLLFTLPLNDKRRSMTLSRVTLAVKTAVAHVGHGMFMLIGTDAYSWGRGVGLMRYRWRSKTEVSAARWTPTVFKIVGDTVRPFTRGASSVARRFALWRKQNCGIDESEYFRLHPNDKRFMPQVLGDGADVILTLYADGEKVYERPVRWAEPVMLRVRRRAIEWSIEVSGTTTLRELHLQKSHNDLQNDGGHA